METGDSPNPISTVDSDLPPPPDNGELVDPAEPHPDEPGAPDDAPKARQLEKPKGDLRA